ncbi:MAG: methylated-DNA--[protein]-cysteine S-methyltransferase [Gallicola sp.]|nr:methylated-DNA--[protein]-cysteine S-methyltransferase [Gallicola sp.]
MKYIIIEGERGKVYLGEKNGKIVLLSFDKEEIKGLKRERTPLLERGEKELLEYFKGERTSFDLPLEYQGTDFQVKVWKALEKIPYGETRTYQDIAEAVGSPKAFRAVGNANNKNPISILIPCHRVIGKSGKLVGYGGGLDWKEYLLGIEKREK